VNKNIVAALQRPTLAVSRAVISGLFTYNEFPTFAVAKDCWFGARPDSTRPFFVPIDISNI
jgi:hypothetical protein